jgi:hypothetical protein
MTQYVHVPEGTGHRTGLTADLRKLRVGDSLFVPYASINNVQQIVLRLAPKKFKRFTAGMGKVDGVQITRVKS